MNRQIQLQEEAGLSLGLGRGSRAIRGVDAAAAIELWSFNLHVVIRGYTVVPHNFIAHKIQIRQRVGQML